MLKTSDQTAIDAEPIRAIIVSGKRKTREKSNVASWTYRPTLYEKLRQDWKNRFGDDFIQQLDALEKTVEKGLEPQPDPTRYPLPGTLLHEYTDAQGHKRAVHATGQGGIYEVVGTYQVKRHNH